MAEINLTNMIAGLEKQVTRVQDYLTKLEQSEGSSVNLSDMFRMQMAMQLMSQYTETTSNSMTAVHQLMMSMAKATKGQ